MDVVVEAVRWVEDDEFEALGRRLHGVSVFRYWSGVVFRDWPEEKP